MYIKKATLEDVLSAVILKVAHGRRTRPSRGPAIELFGVLLKVSNPRARLSARPMSRSGEGLTEAAECLDGNDTVVLSQGCLGLGLRASRGHTDNLIGFVKYGATTHPKENACADQKPSLAAIDAKLGHDSSLMAGRVAMAMAGIAGYLD